jgi:hypothetical protein
VARVPFVVPSREELEDEWCWEADDAVPSRPAMTAFRRATRHRQALWRKERGLPIGTQPIRPKPDDDRARPVGSRLPLDIAHQTGANLVTPAALAAARHRTSFTERHQSFDHQRLWADLLSSEALAFNLFGNLAADLALADRALHCWFPDAPGRVSDVRFAHSPGRLDPSYLNSLRAFDAAFVLDMDDGTRGVLACGVTYHERNKAETPRPENREIYARVAERSGAFADGAVERLLGRTDLCVLWLEHLLVHSMLQHPAGGWTWARYAAIHPADNVDAADRCERYRSMLSHDSTFTAPTLEELLGSGALPATTASLLGERYLLAR